MNWSKLLEGATEWRRKDSPAPPGGRPNPAAEQAAENKELRAQRDRLLEKFTVMQADLGGAFYEMAIRDHVRLDALTRRAAELQQVDAELLAVERQLEIERTDAAGHCPACNSPFGSADRFCPQCGSSLVATEAAS
ncbi:MAG TPA: hypothetical protein VFZ19_10280 [Solirubrobacterales bacterium]